MPMGQAFFHDKGPLFFFFFIYFILFIYFFFFFDRWGDAIVLPLEFLILILAKAWKTPTKNSVGCLSIGQASQITTGPHLTRMPHDECIVDLQISCRQNSTPGLSCVR